MRRLVQRETLVKGTKYDYERLTFVDERGEKMTREIVRHPGAVVIVPILEAPNTGPRLVMIRNHRYSIDRTLLEFPAGTMEPPEPADRCAARELQEESGYAAGKLHALGWFYTTPGMTDERMHAFAATGLEQVGQHLMEDEEITVELVEPARALSMVDSGELRDAKSIVALWMAVRRGLLQA